LDESLDINAILERVPHRYPLLLVDRVLEVHPGHSIRALKNVTYNEPFFTGHFPSRPLMPGVIVIEALAQAASVLWLMSPSRQGQATPNLHLVELNRARFRKPVMPGDQLLLNARIEHAAKATTQFSTVAFVGPDRVADAEVVMAVQTLDA
jgi:3-hydroxyacyl-[acyl-carrier-protein] dehydratase